MKNPAILVLRVKGPRNVTHGQAVTFVETSLDALTVVASARAVLANYDFQTVVLEDLHLHDLPDNVRDAVRAGIREGTSCPVVSRWTKADPNA